MDRPATTGPPHHSKDEPLRVVERFQIACHDETERECRQGTQSEAEPAPQPDGWVLEVEFQPYRRRKSWWRRLLTGGR